MNVEYKGKHAELCRALDDHRLNDAMDLIYAFFRSEDNTDSYSIPALTSLRELIEDGDSAELERIRIRMRSHGDKMLLTLAQFLCALHNGGFSDGAEILAEKLEGELSRMTRSMQEFADEEGLSQATLMAGLRIREAMKLLRNYFRETQNEDSEHHCIEQNLEMTRIFLFSKLDILSTDMMSAAQSAECYGDVEKSIRLCHDMIESFSEKVDDATRSPEERVAMNVALDYAKVKLEL